MGRLESFVRLFVRAFSSGVMMVVDTGKLLVKYPVFLIPLLLSYSVLFSYTYLYEMTSLFAQFNDLQVIAGILFAYSFTLTFTGSLTMEWIQHIENGYQPRLLQGLKDTIIHNMPRLLPVAGLWMTVWIIIVVIEIVIDFIVDKLTFSMAEKMRRAAIRDAMDFIRKGIRMFFFLNIPAIGWQGYGPVSSLQRSWSIVKTHFREFADGYIGTYFIGFALSMLALPIIPLRFTGGITEQQLNLFVVIYGPIVASIIFFLEQLFAGKLFLQVLQWEELRKEDPDLRLDDVDQPDFHDDVPDFKRYD